MSLTQGQNPIGQTAVAASATDLVLTPSSTTLQNVTGLAWAFNAGEVWRVEALLLANGASTTADLKLGWTGPSGMTARWQLAGNVSGSAVGATPTQFLNLAATTAVGAGAFDYGVQTIGVFVCSATPGTLQLQAAQNTATAENDTIYATSHLRLVRLA